MNCEWCCRELDGKSRDHVFSRLLGGQLADGLWVPACTECSKVISKAEDEVAHRSHISLFRLAVGLQPRHPKRSSSGGSRTKDQPCERPSIRSLFGICGSGR